MADVSSKEKAAILIISLGKEYSAKVYRHLSEEEIEQLTLHITSIRRVDPEIKAKVLEEFREICMAQKFITEGGIGYAREILEQAMGPDRAMELINKLANSLQVQPFDFVRRADPSQVLNLIQNEHPQTIALMLSYLDPKQAATVVASLPIEKQTDVMARIATMGVTIPEYIQDAERILEKKLSSMGFSDRTMVGGIDSIVEILNAVDRGTEKHILDSLDVYDAELADEIRKKLFVFEDIAKLSSQAIQRTLKEIDNHDLTLALKGSSAEVSKVIFSNISKRLQEMIAEDLDTMGAVRVKDVEEAQQKIVNAIRRLEDAGEIITSRGSEDEVIV